MKVIAYYLPQFHKVKENDIWWGENFTEWTNTKKMKPLFKGHEQPRVPLNENYYNLLDKDTVKWQSKLAEDFNIYGFCYYHYWFSGKKLLEKPCENLLSWKDIKQNFCFCWANHNWVKNNNGVKEILIKQTYGEVNEWEEHFQYLFKFFKDDRYIKVNNKPVFVVYNMLDITSFDDRMKYYNKRCKECGFNGIFIIESLNTISSKKVSVSSSAAVLREPAIAFTGVGVIERFINIIKRRVLKIPVKYNYEIVFKRILKESIKNKHNKEIIFGTFTDWDNTSRHGKGGSYMSKKDINIFKKYLKLQKDIMRNTNREFIFINAWNEWAEGMYLEPDSINNTGYLEAIKEVVSE